MEEFMTGQGQVILKMSAFNKLSLLRKTNNKQARPSHWL